MGAEVVGPGSEVIRVRRLKGGTASAMHAVDVRAAGGSVVRLFRHNLIFHFGYEAAERFAGIYEAVTGERPDPFWEALTLPVTWGDSTARVEAFNAYASSLVMKLC